MPVARCSVMSGPRRHEVEVEATPSLQASEPSSSDARGRGTTNIDDAIYDSAKSKAAMNSNTIPQRQALHFLRIILRKYRYTLTHSRADRNFLHFSFGRI